MTARKVKYESAFYLFKIYFTTKHI